MSSIPFRAVASGRPSIHFLSPLGLLIAFGALLGTLLVGCGEPLPPLQDVQVPDLALAQGESSAESGSAGNSVEPAAREHIEEAEAAVAKAKRRGDRERLAAAMGAYGDVLHAYELTAPATTAYENARTLDPGNYVWPYSLGMLAQTAGDFPAARGHFESALELRSGYLPARVRLADVLLSLGEAAVAKEILEEIDGGATGRQADYAAAMAYALGRAEASLGNADAARDQLATARALAPESGAIAYAYAEALRRLGDSAAADAVKVVGALPPTFPDPLAEHVEGLPRGAGALMRQGNQALMAAELDQAEDLFSRAIEADDQRTEAYINLAVTHMRQGQFADAREVLERAIAASGDADVATRAQLHHDLGNTQRALGRNEAALESFAAALELSPDYLDAHFNLANTYGVLGRWSDVEASTTRVLELDPEHHRARYLLAMAGFEQGRRDEAERELRQLIDEQPSESVFRQGLAQILAKTGRGGEAIEVLKASDGVAPQDQVELLRSAALEAWKRGRRGEAISLWRNVSQLLPTSKSFTDLANALQLNGERQEAVSHFARATELDPSNATAWLAEARLWVLAGQLERAVERLDAALAHHPGDPGLSNTLARVLATAPDPELRDGRRAVELARIAYGVELSIEHGETLAMALAEMGNFEQALGVQNRLLQQAQAQGDQATLRRLVLNLRRYQNRTPVRVTTEPQPRGNRRR